VSNLHARSVFDEIYWRKIPLTGLNQTWCFKRAFRLPGSGFRAPEAKSTNILLASVGMILFSPLLLLSAFGVWIWDRGPVFFAPKRRIGKNRVPFQIYKFRTMRSDAGTGGAA